MSGDRQDSARRQRDGELVLQSNVAQVAQLALPEPKSKLLEVLERRSQPRQSQPRRRKDVKARLVSQWKQTLALSSVTARKLVTEPPPAPKPTPRRAPPRPPNPLRSPGRTEVSRIRREEAAKPGAPEPAKSAAPKPVVAATPKPHAPTPSRWIPTLPSLSKRIAEAAVQTAGTMLLVLAVKTGTALTTLAEPKRVVGYGIRSL